MMDSVKGVHLKSGKKVVEATKKGLNNNFRMNVSGHGNSIRFTSRHISLGKEFKEAVDEIQGPMRQIFVEFLEMSCTAEVSGFLLYKELGGVLKVLT
ncbi:hypothetical protein L2E82_25531 [Cichorium intybus]|uniref:Uncharacterized protein n=1 Tax=Cichorium intybus TaxID=13427 RepID=A0ACB9E4T5_CICIN|nr:hypothetical protein L2E82_25531 [Cichorium intybus]